LSLKREIEENPRLNQRTKPFSTLLLVPFLGEKTLSSFQNILLMPVALFVGRKPSMNYVPYILNQMKDQKEIVVKARGKASGNNF